MRFTTVLTALLTTSIVAAQTVYLIRHGEKPTDDGDGLSAQGVQRAQCLRKVFGNESNYDIGYIIAEKPKEGGKRARPLDTVLPLAEDLNLEVDTSCGRNKPDCVADLVNGYSGDGNVLICWEHKVLTDIITSLGDGDAPTYPTGSFDIVWTDPYPYNSITATTSEDCPGLDAVFPTIQYP